MAQGQEPSSPPGQRPTWAVLWAALWAALSWAALPWAALPWAALAAMLTLGSAAAPAREALTGKTVTIYVGFGPGGGYDLYARVLARHLGRHLPGHPTVVVANMPGAASIRATNYIANVAYLTPFPSPRPSLPITVPE